MKTAIFITFRQLYLFFNSLKRQIYNGECRAFLKTFLFVLNRKVLKGATVCLCVSLLLVGVGCKKKSKELTTVNFHLFNPVTNEAFAGVKVSILQEKNTSSGFNSGSETEVVWEGVTDANGKASYSFKAYNSTKYSYWQTVEESFYFNSTLHKIQQPAFLPLNKNEANEVVYKSVKQANYLTWRKNTNCYDENDKCRMRMREYLFWADVWGDWGDWGPASGSGYYEGCYESISQVYTDTQKLLGYEMEITRNNIIDTLEQTFYITGQNGTDTLKYFY